MDMALDDPPRTLQPPPAPGNWAGTLPQEQPQYQVPLNSTLTSTDRDKGFMANYGFNTYDESPLQHEMRKENVAKWKISPGQQEAAAPERLEKIE